LTKSSIIYTKWVPDPHKNIFFFSWFIMSMIAVFLQVTFIFKLYDNGKVLGIHCSSY
jgi:hypothetical protein